MILFYPIYQLTIFCWSFFAIVARLAKGQGIKGALEKLRAPAIPTGEQKRVWIHSVSLGESKAACGLVAKLRQSYPDSEIVFSTSTSTGYAYLLKQKHLVDHVFHLPIDLTPLVVQTIRRVNPSHFFIVETDFWWNLIRHLKKRDVPVILLNGKLSERTFNRYQKVPRLASKLFKQIDQACVQTSDYAEGFKALGCETHTVNVSGNLKFEMKNHIRTPEIRLPKLQYLKRPIIAIALTHPGEEELVLEAVRQVKFGTLLVCPRHPDRFEKVAKMLGENEVIVDEMGVMDQVYTVVDVVVMCGSFVKGIGGHNLLEAALLKKYVLFGPHMDDQKEIVKLVTESKMGESVTLEELPGAVNRLLDQPKTCDKEYETLLGMIGNPVDETIKLLEERFSFV